MKIGLLDIVMLILFAFKLLGLINVSWFIVVLPFVIEVAIIFLAAIAGWRA